MLTPGSVCVLRTKQQPWACWVGLKADFWSSLASFIPFVFLVLYPLSDGKALRAHRIQGVGITRDLYNMSIFANCTDLIFLQHFNWRFHFPQLTASSEIVTIR